MSSSSSMAGCPLCSRAREPRARPSAPRRRTPPSPSSPASRRSDSRSQGSRMRPSASRSRTLPSTSSPAGRHVGSRAQGHCLRPSGPEPEVAKPTIFGRPPFGQPSPGIPYAAQCFFEADIVKFVVFSQAPFWVAELRDLACGSLLLGAGRCQVHFHLWAGAFGVAEPSDPVCGPVLLGAGCLHPGNPAEQATFHLGRFFILSSARSTQFRPAHLRAGVLGPDHSPEVKTDPGGRDLSYGHKPLTGRCGHRGTAAHWMHSMHHRRARHCHCPLWQWKPIL